MTTAIYPGSFDPVTNGHVDITRRAARLFDRVIVAVYATPEKNILFTTDERVAMFQQAVEDLPNVTVQSYTGLTVGFMRQVDAPVMVRGLRGVPDFEWEFQMAQTNHQLAPEMEMVCLMARVEYGYVSSTIVKQVASLGGAVEAMVPRHVAEALYHVYKKQRHG